MNKEKIQKVLDYITEVNKKRNTVFAYKFFKDNLYLTNPINPFKDNQNKYSASTVIIPGTNYVFSCSKDGRLGDIADIAPKIDDSVKDMDKAEVIHYLRTKYNIVLDAPTQETYLNAYKHYGFDLVPLVAKEKIPFERDWVNREYKDIDDWKKWLSNGLNIGIKTGIRSGITVIDIDTQEIPECLKNCDTLIQKTNKGYHYVFKYEKDIPSSRISELKIDILNDGKQFVVCPSIIDNIIRQWNFHDYKNTEIPTMSDEIKQFVLENIKKQPKSVNVEEKIKTDIENNAVSNMSNLQQGERNIGLTKIGGILRKQLNIDQTSYVMNLVNRSFVRPPLSGTELRTIINSLDKYSNFDDADLAKKIHDYLRYAEDGTSRDIQQAIGESKSRIDKALAYLVKEQVIIKKNRMFKLLKKVEWSDVLTVTDESIDFKIPYFHDIAHFNWGDMILLGGKTKTGKTTVAMNVVKSLVDQGIKPHYICLESGSRYKKTAQRLGMKDGDFFSSIQTDPTSIEIENNSVTILDWLLIDNKGESDIVMKYFINQLVKTHSVLIVFMQLKQDNSWFAPNMINQFPAFSARYIYEDEHDGTNGAWHIDAIREAKRQIKQWSIPCQYDWESRKLTRVDELPDFRIKKTAEEIIV